MDCLIISSIELYKPILPIPFISVAECGTESCYDAWIFRHMHRPTEAGFNLLSQAWIFSPASCKHYGVKKIEPLHKGERTACNGFMYSKGDRFS